MLRLQLRGCTATPTGPRACAETGPREATASAPAPAPPRRRLASSTAAAKLRAKPKQTTNESELHPVDVGLLTSIAVLVWHARQQVYIVNESGGLLRAWNTPAQRTSIPDMLRLGYLRAPHHRTLGHAPKRLVIACLGSAGTGLKSSETYL